MTSANVTVGNLERANQANEAKTSLTGISAAADQTGSNNPAGPFFDQTGFDDFKTMMGAARIGTWLAQLKEILETTFVAERTVVIDRPQLGRSAHAVVSLAGSLGFSELAELCSELDAACKSGSNISLPLAKVEGAARTACHLLAQLSEPTSVGGPAS